MLFFRFDEPLNEPETDQQNQDERGQREPRDRDDFDSHFANRRNVIVDIWVSLKEAVKIAKHVNDREDVDYQNEHRREPHSGKRAGLINASMTF